MNRWIIIDGYSLLHVRGLGGDLQAAREQLLRSLSAVQAQLAEQITVVFDGRSSERQLPNRDARVEVLFSRAGQTADAVIEEVVHQAPRPGDILVVTNDRAEQDTVIGAGAQTRSCEAFLDELERITRQVSGEQQRLGRGAKSKGPRLGDFFPDD